MTSNLFTDLPPHFPAEFFTTLLESAHVRIERIVSHGHATPPGSWYDQHEGEWVIVLKGAARIEFSDRVLTMQPGDFLDIPAQTRHRVAWTTPDGPTIWLAIHYAANR